METGVENRVVCFGIRTDFVHFSIREFRGTMLLANCFTNGVCKGE